MRVTLLLSLLLLISCGRPLTEAEKSFTHQLFGDTANTNQIRFHDGALVGKVTYTRQKRPQLACRERIWPEPKVEKVTVAPAAITLYNTIFYSKDFYTNDYFPDYPSRLHLFAAMLFAHEMTHVWQWQNRAKTGYTPLKAAREHDFKDDPYLYDISTKTRFLDFAYEQQASIVEEYVCCTALDPQAPRTARLRALLEGAFPIGTLHIPNEIKVPFDGARRPGICR